MSYTPKTKQGKAAVARLGRTKATGNFAKIAAKSGDKVAGAIYWSKVRKHLAG